MVESKTVSADTFSITLKTVTTRRTFSQSPPGEDELKVLKHLVEGREYEFPKVFDDVLCKKSANMTSSTASSTMTSTTFNSRLPSFNTWGLPAGVLELAKTTPFRARVLSKKVKDDEVSIDFRTTDGRPFTVQQIGSPGIKEAQRIASQLQEGKVYEFPDDAVVPDAGKKPAKKSEMPTPSEEMKVLEGLIGKWEMPMQSDPSRKVVLSFVWKKDGRGIWREIHDEPPSDSKRIDNAWLITYDTTRKCYVESPIRTNIVPREVEMRWDVTTRTLSSRAAVDYPEPGTIQTGTRQLVSEDHMEWRFSSVTPEGRPTGENSGFYTRVKR